MKTGADAKCILIPSLIFGYLEFTLSFKAGNKTKVYKKKSNYIQCKCDDFFTSSSRVKFITPLTAIKIFFGKYSRKISHQFPLCLHLLTRTGGTTSSQKPKAIRQ